MTKDRGIVITDKIYRNTSQLIKIFLENNGFVLGYAKGIYRIKKSDFDGPFKTFFEYEVEVHGNPECNDVVLITSSKCIAKIDYTTFDKLLFFKKIQNFIEFFFVLGYRNVSIYNFLSLFITYSNKFEKQHFLHYAYFVCNILKLLGLLNSSSVSRLKLSKRMHSFIKFLLSSNLLKKTNLIVENSLCLEFDYFVKNNFHQYYNNLYVQRSGN